MMMSNSTHYANDSHQGETIKESKNSKNQDQTFLVPLNPKGNNLNNVSIISTQNQAAENVNPSTVKLSQSLSSMNQSFSTMSSSQSLSSISILSSKTSMNLDVTMDTSNSNNTFNFFGLLTYTGEDKEFGNLNEYLEDIYSNLLDEENKENAVLQKNFISKQPQINEKVRAVLVNWIIEIQVNALNFSERTLFYTIRLIDCYLSARTISTEYFQLLGIGALLIAIKHEEYKIIALEELCSLTLNAYTKEQLIEMENDILMAIKFQVLHPIPYDYFTILAKVLGLSEDAKNFGLFFMESYLLDSIFYTISPSILALSCAYVSMKFFKIPNYQVCYNQVLNAQNADHYYVKYYGQKICVFMNQLANSGEFDQIIKKFKSSKYGEVANLIQ